MVAPRSKLGLGLGVVPNMFVFIVGGGVFDPNMPEPNGEFVAGGANGLKAELLLAFWIALEADGEGPADRALNADPAVAESAGVVALPDESDCCHCQQGCSTLQSYSKDTYIAPAYS